MIRAIKHYQCPLLVFDRYHYISVGGGRRSWVCHSQALSRLVGQTSPLAGTPLMSSVPSGWNSLTPWKSKKIFHHFQNVHFILLILLGWQKLLCCCFSLFHSSFWQINEVWGGNPSAYYLWLYTQGWGEIWRTNSEKDHLYWHTLMESAYMWLIVGFLFCCFHSDSTQCLTLSCA